MTDILTATGVISLIVMGVTQLVKQQLSDNKHLPVINLIVGVAIGLSYALSMGLSLNIYGWAGLIAGLSAGGFYDLSKSYIKKEEK